MSDEEKRSLYGKYQNYLNNCLETDLAINCESSCSGYNPYQGYGYGVGYGCGFFPGYVNGVSIDQYFIQYLTYLRGEGVKVLLEHSCALCGRLIQIECNFISVSVEGTVAYIPFSQIVAVIPI